MLQPLGARYPLALWTVAIAAGSIVDVGVLAVVAPFDNSAQDGRSAVFNGLHQAMLIQRQAMRLPIVRAVLSKDVGQLQGRLRHGRSAGGRGGARAFRLGWFAQPVEGTAGVGDGVGRDGGITCRGLDPGVAQQRLNHANIGAVLQQVRRKAVAAMPTSA